MVDLFGELSGVSFSPEGDGGRLYASVSGAPAGVLQGALRGGAHAGPC